MNLYKHPDGHVFYRKMNHARPKIATGKGIYLVDEQGKEYLDGSGGPLVVNVGHGRQEVLEAISQQAGRAAYVHAMMFTSEPVEALSATLAPLVPLPNPRFFYLSSGSEVVEGALKLARQIQQARGEPQRQMIISRAQSYHGMTLGALAVSGRPSLREPYLAMLNEQPQILPPYPYRRAASGEALASELEAAILRCGAARVAAFIAEPISGAGLGSIVPPADYWPRIREICDRYGVLLIADEVLVGLGRTGKWWGIDHWAVSPDILVTSKGLAGGYFPLGMIAARHEDVEQIRQALGDWNHGGTFSHHAVGAAAALAVVNILRQERLVEKAAVLGRYLGQKLVKAFGNQPQVGDIRGVGLFWSLEFVEDRESKRPFPAQAQIAWRIWQRAFELGLIVYYSQGCANGVDGDLIMLGPPLIATAEQVDQMVALLSQAVADVLNQ